MTSSKLTITPQHFLLRPGEHTPVDTWSVPDYTPAPLLGDLTWEGGTLDSLMNKIPSATNIS